MNEKNQIKELLKWFGCNRAPTTKAITTDLGVNLTESKLIIEKIINKDIKKRLENLVNSNVTLLT